MCLWNAVDHSLEWTRLLDVRVSPTSAQSLYASHQHCNGLLLCFSIHLSLVPFSLSHFQEHGHCADFHPSGAVVAIGTHSGKYVLILAAFS